MYVTFAEVYIIVRGIGLTRQVMTPVQVISAGMKKHKCIYMCDRIILIQLIIDTKYNNIIIHEHTHLYNYSQ